MALSPALLLEYALLGADFLDQLNRILRRARTENWTPEKLRAEWRATVSRVLDAERAWEDAASGDPPAPESAG